MSQPDDKIYSADDLMPYVNQMVAISMFGAPLFGILKTNGEYFGFPGLPGGFLPKHVKRVNAITVDVAINSARAHIELQG